MKQDQFFILLEVAVAAWLMLLLGLPIHALLRRRKTASAATAGAPDAPAGFSFSGRDLAFSLGICWVFMSLLLASGAEAAFGKPALTSNHPASLTSGLVTVLILQSVQVFLIVAYLRVGRRVSPVQIFGIGRHPPLKSFGLAVVMILPAATAALLLAQLVHAWGVAAGWDLQEQETVQLLRTSSDFTEQLLLLLVACVGAPVMEELLFRGMVYNGLKRFSDTWFALLASSLLFAVMHAHLLTLPSLFVLGLFFALAYEATGSLLVSILMHLLFNASQACSILLTNGTAG
ncbi:MAG: CPBP family intramembrane metalloprotease [Verrucomicrobiales bacterium]|nr:CPBP family intramembrane metalloprotease [Verrucomicrobiales bacterium]